VADAHDEGIAPRARLRENLDLLTVHETELEQPALEPTLTTEPFVPGGRAARLTKPGGQSTPLGLVTASIGQVWMRTVRICNQELCGLRYDRLEGGAGMFFC